MVDEPFNRGLLRHACQMNLKQGPSSFINHRKQKRMPILYILILKKFQMLNCVIFWMVDEPFNSQLSAFSKVGSLSMNEFALVKSFLMRI